MTNELSLQDQLPLTCSRTGTCCHGKQVFLNPWELAILAREKRISPKEFLDLYCEHGGIVLRFNGIKDPSGKSACSQYVENFGCSVHNGRPLACRLFPLGRQIQSEKTVYIYQGETFPCLNGCPEVKDLPYLSVEDYLKGQQTTLFEKAQDEYLELMQNLADIAFTLLLDTGLAESGETQTLSAWRKIGKTPSGELAATIGDEWLEHLILPDLSGHIEDPVSFIQMHNEQLQKIAQEKFGGLTTFEELHEASVLMMTLALYLARALGADPQILAEHWIVVAKENGACE